MEPTSASHASGSQDRPDLLVSLSHEMSRMFDTFLTGASSLMSLSAPPAFSSCVKLDVVEDRQHLHLSAELPGMRAQDVTLQLDGRLLCLSGHKHAGSNGHADHAHILERSFGQFFRTVTLPFAPDPQSVRADFCRGVLSIQIPKPESGESIQRIDVHERMPEWDVPHTGMEPSADGVRTGVAPREEEGAESAPASVKRDFDNLPH